MKNLDSQTDDAMPRFESCDPSVTALIEQYASRLHLPSHEMWVTSDRHVYSRWLGRKIPSSYGGAYCFLKQPRVHAVLINLARIDLSQPRSLEVVVAEELIHMRDRLDGDLRGHAKHGYDRIAYRVAEVTGASLDEIRSALIPVTRRPYRYVYACPGCGVRVRRKKKGRWSCGRCASGFDPRFELRIVEYLEP